MTYRFAHKIYRRPLQVPLRTAHGPWTERVGIIVRLEDEGGHAGFGEVAPIPWFGTETVEEAAAYCRRLGDSVNATTLDALPEKMGCLRFALVQARAEFSGEGEAIKVDAPSANDERPAGVKRLAVAALLPAGRGAIAAIEDRLEAGFLAFKWKVGVNAPEEEFGVLDDLLARLPAHAKLRLDANGAWTSRQAVRWLERCAERPIEFVEQPVAPGAEDALLGLAQDFPVTLALDESVVRVAEARRWQGLGWRGVFVMKPALCGSLAELCTWITGTSADVVLSSAIETTLARSAILREALRGGLTRRALGFGMGEMFGSREWDGPAIGPLADVACIAQNAGEAIWTALD